MFNIGFLWWLREVIHFLIHIMKQYALYRQQVHSEYEGICL